jgi:hypothetical protein
VQWRKLLTYPTEFGLDYLRVQGSQPVRVEAITLVGGAGHLRLVEASIAPGGGVGVFTYTGNDQKRLPVSFRSRLAVPGAILTERHASESELRADPSANAYQVVVGVIPTSNFGSAESVRIRYRVGATTHTVTGTHFVIVSEHDSPCDRAALVPTP